MNDRTDETQPRPGQAPFRELLDSGGLALFDGAMGTELYAKGVFIHRAFEELNLSEPGLVREVHAAYLAAGADVLETNTFAANRFRLSPHGLADKVEEINLRGAQIAREVAEGEAWVGGAIGPLGVRIEPFGPIAVEEAADVFRQQAAALVKGGVDLLVLETFAHLPELEIAIRAAREVTALPIVAQVVVTSGAVTREGVDAAEAAQKMAAAGADVVGVNCSDALTSLESLEEMRASIEVPLCAQPNAGRPRTVDGRKIYLASAEYLVAWARRAVRLGVRVIGGCCGSSPDHIRALKQQIMGGSLPRISSERVALPRHHKPPAEPTPLARKSAMAAALAAQRFVWGVEIPPKRGWVADDFVATARRLRLAGMTFMSLPEGTPHLAHLLPSTVAQLTHNEGVEPIVHYSCRGRRLARMQSELLGAYATGAANLLAVTGDPLVGGLEKDDDFDELEVDSIGLVQLVNRLNHGEDLGGNPIGRPTGLHIGIRLDPTAHDRPRELSRYRWKLEAGAEFALTSPVFDVDALERLLADLGGERLPVIATIFPLTSAVQAEFFEERMASVPVPQPLVDRMRAAEEAGREAEEGLAIACELAQALRPLVEGLNVVAVGGDAERALEVIDAVR